MNELWTWNCSHLLARMCLLSCLGFCSANPNTVKRTFLCYYFAPWIRFARCSSSFCKTCCLDSLIPRIQHSFKVSAFPTSLGTAVQNWPDLHPSKNKNHDMLLVEKPSYILQKACLCPLAAFHFPVASQTPFHKTKPHQTPLLQASVSPRVFHPAPELPGSRAWDEAASLWRRPRLEARLAT